MYKQKDLVQPSLSSSKTEQGSEKGRALLNDPPTNFMEEGSSILYHSYDQKEKLSKNSGGSNFMQKSSAVYPYQVSSVEEYLESIFSKSDQETIIELKQILINLVHKHSSAVENLNWSQASITSSAGFMQKGPYPSDQQVIHPLPEPTHHKAITSTIEFESYLQLLLSQFENESSQRSVAELKKIFEVKLVEHLENNPPKKLYFPELKEIVKIYKVNNKQSVLTTHPVEGLEIVENRDEELSGQGSQGTENTTEKIGLGKSKEKPAINLFDLVNIIKDRNVLKTLKKSVETKLKDLGQEDKEDSDSMSKKEGDLSRIKRDESNKEELNILVNAQISFKDDDINFDKNNEYDKLLEVANMQDDNKKKQQLMTAISKLLEQSNIITLPPINKHEHNTNQILEAIQMGLTTVQSHKTLDQTSVARLGHLRELVEKLHNKIVPPSSKSDEASSNILHSEILTSEQIKQTLQNTTNEELLREVKTIISARLQDSTLAKYDLSTSQPLISGAISDESAATGQENIVPSEKEIMKFMEKTSDAKILKRIINVIQDRLVVLQSETTTPAPIVELSTIMEYISQSTNLETVKQILDKATEKVNNDKGIVNVDTQKLGVEQSHNDKAGSTITSTTKGQEQTLESVMQLIETISNKESLNKIHIMVTSKLPVSQPTNEKVSMSVAPSTEEDFDKLLEVANMQDDNKKKQQLMTAISKLLEQSNIITLPPINKHEHNTNQILEAIQMGLTTVQSHKTLDQTSVARLGHLRELVEKLHNKIVPPSSKSDEASSNILHSEILTSEQIKQTLQNTTNEELLREVKTIISARLQDSTLAKYDLSTSQPLISGAISDESAATGQENIVPSEKEIMKFMEKTSDAKILKRIINVIQDRLVVLQSETTTPAPIVELSTIMEYISQSTNLETVKQILDKATEKVNNDKGIVNVDTQKLGVEQSHNDKAGSTITSTTKGQEQTLESVMQLIETISNKESLNKIHIMVTSKLPVSQPTNEKVSMSVAPSTEEDFDKLLEVANMQDDNKKKQQLMTAISKLLEQSNIITLPPINKHEHNTNQILEAIQMGLTTVQSHKTLDQTSVARLGHLRELVEKLHNKIVPPSSKSDEASSNILHSEILTSEQIKQTLQNTTNEELLREVKTIISARLQDSTLAKYDLSTSQPLISGAISDESAATGQENIVPSEKEIMKFMEKTSDAKILKRIINVIQDRLVVLQSETTTPAPIVELSTIMEYISQSTNLETVKQILDKATEKVNNDKGIVNVDTQKLGVEQSHNDKAGSTITSTTKGQEQTLESVMQLIETISNKESLNKIHIMVTSKLPVSQPTNEKVSMSVAPSTEEDFDKLLEVANMQDDNKKKQQLMTAISKLLEQSNIITLPPINKHEHNTNQILEAIQMGLTTVQSHKTLDQTSVARLGHLRELVEKLHNKIVPPSSKSDEASSNILHSEILTSEQIKQTLQNTTNEELLREVKTIISARLQDSTLAKYDLSTSQPLISGAISDESAATGQENIVPSEKEIMKFMEKTSDAKILKRIINVIQDRLVVLQSETTTPAPIVELSTIMEYISQSTNLETVKQILDKATEKVNNDKGIVNVDTQKLGVEQSHNDKAGSTITSTTKGQEQTLESVMQLIETISNKESLNKIHIMVTSKLPVSQPTNEKVSMSVAPSTEEDFDKLLEVANMQDDNKKKQQLMTAISKLLEQSNIITLPPINKHEHNTNQILEAIQMGLTTVQSHKTLDQTSVARLGHLRELVEKLHNKIVPPSSKSDEASSNILHSEILTSEQIKQTLQNTTNEELLREVKTIISARLQDSTLAKYDLSTSQPLISGAISDESAATGQENIVPSEKEIMKFMEKTSDAKILKRIINVIQDRLVVLQSETTTPAPIVELSTIMEYISQSTNLETVKQILDKATEKVNNDKGIVNVDTQKLGVEQSHNDKAGSTITSTTKGQEQTLESVMQLIETISNKESLNKIHIMVTSKLPVSQPTNEKVSMSVAPSTEEDFDKLLEVANMQDDNKKKQQLMTAISKLLEQSNIITLPPINKHEHNTNQILEAIQMGLTTVQSHKTLDQTSVARLGHLRELVEKLHNKIVPPSSKSDEASSNILHSEILTSEQIKQTLQNTTNEELLREVKTIISARLQDSTLAKYDLSTSQPLISGAISDESAATGQENIVPSEKEIMKFMEKTSDAKILKRIINVIQDRLVVLQSETTTPAPIVELSTIMEYISQSTNLETVKQILDKATEKVNNDKGIVNVDTQKLGVEQSHNDKAGSTITSTTKGQEQTLESVMQLIETISNKESLNKIHIMVTSKLPVSQPTNEKVSMSVAPSTEEDFDKLLEVANMQDDNKKKQQLMTAISKLLEQSNIITLPPINKHEHNTNQILEAIQMGLTTVQSHKTLDQTSVARLGHLRELVEKLHNKIVPPSSKSDEASSNILHSEILTSEQIKQTLQNTTNEELLREVKTIISARLQDIFLNNNSSFCIQNLSFSHSSLCSLPSLHNSFILQNLLLFVDYRLLQIKSDKPNPLYQDHHLPGRMGVLLFNSTVLIFKYIDNLLVAFDAPEAYRIELSSHLKHSFSNTSKYNVARKANDWAEMLQWLNKEKDLQTTLLKLPISWKFGFTFQSSVPHKESDSGAEH